MRFQHFSALPRASSSLLIVVSRPANGISQDFRLLLLLGLILFLPLDSNRPIANAQTPATSQKYEHDKWKTEPRELFFEYDAFGLSFDDVDEKSAQKPQSRSPQTTPTSRD
jgi:hypothetical protein